MRKILSVLLIGKLILLSSNNGQLHAQTIQSKSDNSKWIVLKSDADIQLWKAVAAAKYDSTENKLWPITLTNGNTLLLKKNSDGSFSYFSIANTSIAQNGNSLFKQASINSKNEQPTIGSTDGAVDDGNVKIYNNATGDTLKLTNNITGQGAGDGLDLSIVNNDAKITNLENGNFSLGTNGASNLIIDNTGKVGINTGNTALSANLEVNGTIAVKGANPGVGKVLTSDATGNASWQNISYTETDPKIGATVNTGLVMWNGSQLISANEKDSSNYFVVNGPIKIKGGTPGIGKILTSDANGNASWEMDNSAKFNLTVNNAIPRNNNGVLQDGSIIDNGTNVIINNPIRITSGGPANGKILTSDATGNASWQTNGFTELDPKVGGLQNNVLQKWNGTKMVDGIVVDNGTKITVNGPIQILGGTPALGRVLTSDANGNGSWQNITYTESDPKITVTQANSMPKWDGTTLSNGIISDSGSKATINGALQVKGGNPAVGKYLASDANGNATWQIPTVVENDPKIGTISNNYYPKWNGTTLADGIISESGSVATVNGSMKITGGNPGAGKLLTSDATGNATWAPLSYTESDPKVNVTTSNAVPRWNGASLINGIITDNGSTASVNGLLQITGGNPGAGKVLISDANGTGTWQSNTVTETDPKIATTTTNALPKWNGTSLVDGIVSDNGTKATINGTVQITGGAPASGRVLTSDASGNAQWLAITETDPKIGSLTNGTISKWNGTALVNSLITEAGTTATVGGTLKITGGNPGAGKALISDASGNASWQTYEPTSGFSASVVNPTVPAASSGWHFAGTPATITITSTTQVLMVQGVIGLGLTLSNNAAFSLDIGYKLTSAATVTNAAGVDNIQLSPELNGSEIKQYNVVGRITGLAPGTYQFGIAVNGPAGYFNNNDNQNLIWTLSKN
jgi:hypothetical protein